MTMIGGRVALAAEPALEAEAAEAEAEAGAVSQRSS